MPVKGIGPVLEPVAKEIWDTRNILLDILGMPPESLESVTIEDLQSGNRHNLSDLAAMVRNKVNNMSMERR